MLDERGVRLCGHDSPHGEEAGTCLSLFQTVSEEVFSETELSVCRFSETDDFQVPRG